MFRQENTAFRKTARADRVTISEGIHSIVPIIICRARASSIASRVLSLTSIFESG